MLIRTTIDKWDRNPLVRELHPAENFIRGMPESKTYIDSPLHESPPAADEAEGAGNAEQ